MLNRLDSPKNEAWVITDGANIYGTVFIDGDGLGENKAHLRAFIVDNSLRGQGLGRKLIEKAMAFVDSQGFVETHLYIFNGLDGKQISQGAYRTSQMLGGACPQDLSLEHSAQSE